MCKVYFAGPDQVFFSEFCGENGKKQKKIGIWKSYMGAGWTE